MPGGDDDAAAVRNRLHELLVDPVRAGVAQVGLDRVVGGHGLATHDVGLGQHPSGMADGRHRLERLVHVPGQGHHRWAGPDLVRRIATGNHQGVELTGADLVDAALDDHRGTVLAGDSLPGPQPDDHRLMPGVSDSVVWHLKLGVLEQVVKDERHSRHVSALASHASRRQRHRTSRRGSEEELSTEETPPSAMEHQGFGYAISLAEKRTMEETPCSVTIRSPRCCWPRTWPRRGSSTMTGSGWRSSPRTTTPSCSSAAPAPTWT